MSISSLNRSSSSPLSSTSFLKPASSPAPSVESTPAAQPRNDLRQALMSDSFEQGPGKLGNASGGVEKMMQQMAQVMGEIMQMLQAMQAQMKGNSGGSSGDGSQAPMSGVGGGAGGAAQAAPADATGGADDAAQAAPADATGGADDAAQAAPADATGGADDAAQAAAPAAPAPAAAAAPAQAPAPTAAPSADVSKTPASASTADKAMGPGSSAGPGFGAPSAGSTTPAPAGQPWLAKNNVGSPYNSNMLLIDQGQKNQYKYTNTFTNKTNQPQTITLWNKTGQDGNPNSGQSFDKSTPKTFTLQPGQSQTVAFDNNSSVAWCASKDGSAKAGANSGQTWGEASFGNAATGWSGYDTSQIAPAGHNGNMSITNDATGKTVTQADAWQSPSDNPAGHDVGVPAGPLNLSTTLG